MFAATLPGMAVRVHVLEVTPLLAAACYGLAIMAASFLLSWSAEALQRRLPAGLIVGLVALIVVLPEYAISMVFTWKAGLDFAEYGGYPLANMTGANRLLIGLGWPMIFFIFWLKNRKRNLELHRTQAFELLTIGIATLYAFFIWFRGSIVWYDAAVLILIFAAYFVLISRTEKNEEHKLLGPAKTLGSLKALHSWIACATLLVLSGVVIFLSADPFGESLIHVGESMGIDRFILIQWIAPLASESPEFIVAALFVTRISAQTGMATLISSKVNQWTLLIASLAIVYMIATTSFAPFPLDKRQSDELLLTATQSLFAVVLLSRLRVSPLSMGVILVLFLTQLMLPSSAVRTIFSYIYLGGTVALVVFDPGRIKALVLMAVKAVREGDE